MVQKVILKWNRLLLEAAFSIILIFPQQQFFKHHECIEDNLKPCKTLETRILRKLKQDM